MKEIVLFIILFVCSMGNAPACAETLRVGFIVPLSGPAATWGREIHDAAVLSLNQLPAETRERINLVFEDDQFQPKQTVSAYRKLTSLRSRVSIVVLLGGATSSAVAPLAETDGIPAVAITGAPSVARNRKFVMRHWVSVEDQARVVAEQLTKSGAKRLVLVLTEDEPPLQFADAFRKYAKASGMTILAEQAVAPPDKDFRTICSRILHSKAEAVVTALLPGHLGIFAKQLRELDRRLPIFGFSGSESKGEILAAAGALEGLIYAGSEPSRDFRIQYQEAYGRDPELAAPNAYDVVQMVGAAVQMGYSDKGALNDYLHRLSSITGSFGNYGVGTENDFLIPAVAKTVRDGKFTPLEVSR